MALSKVKIFSFVIAIMLVSTIVSFFVAIAVSAQKNQIYPGVYVGDTDLGMLSRQASIEKLQDLQRQIGQKEVMVSYAGGEKHFTLRQIDADIGIEGLIEKAWQYGRQGNLIEQWQERKRLARNGVSIPLEVEYSKEKFTNLIKDLCGDAEVKPVDAKLIITPQETVEIVPGKNGKVIDTDNALEQIDQIIKNKQEPVINVALQAQEPEQTTEDVENMQVNGVLARFSTFFNVQKTNRVLNIKVAADALDGQFIKPGETYSFNKVVGPRSKEAGYKLAPAILNNEFIDSLGGGVCQVSTTLYNALLMAGIDITERSNHSLVISYVPLGQDAAVAYGGKDLKFKNNLPGWLVLKTEVVGSRITVKVFGDTGKKREVRITNEVIKTYPYKTVEKHDPSIPKGERVIKQKGVNGYKVTSKRHYYENGKLVASENLPSSFYKALDQIVLVGTKKAAGKKKPVTDQPVQIPEDQDTIGGDPGNTNPEPDAGNQIPTVPDTVY